jgi:hypothetical protein
MRDLRRNRHQIATRVSDASVPRTSAERTIARTHRTQRIAHHPCARVSVVTDAPIARGVAIVCANFVTRTTPVLSDVSERVVASWCKARRRPGA